MRLNKWGNSQPEGQEIYTVKVIKEGHRFFKKGTKLEVMESNNPNFMGKWRVTDSMFIDKSYCNEPT